MFELAQTDVYRRWFRKLRDSNAKARVDMRLERLARGNFGDGRFVGAGVFELRIDYGAGYRVYCIRTGDRVILLLAGGDKRSQSRDIETAIELAQAFRTTS